MKERNNRKQNKCGIRKIFKAALVFLSAIAMLTLLSSCPNPVVHGNGSALGRVVVRIGDGGGRNLLPSSQSFTKYTLTFSAEGKADVVAELTGDNANSLSGGGFGVDLEPGTWSLRVTAYAGTAPNYTASAESAAPVELRITGGSVTSQSIKLIPIEPDVPTTGTLSWTIRFPVLSGSDTATLKVRRVADPVDVIPPVDLFANAVTTPPDMTASGTAPLLPGYYELLINLSKDNKDAGRAEVAYVFSGLTTEAPFTFIDDDFVSMMYLTGELPPPANSSGLTLTAVTIQALDVSETPLSDPATVNLDSHEWALKVPFDTTQVKFKQKYFLSDGGGFDGVYEVETGVISSFASGGGAVTDNLTPSSPIPTFVAKVDDILCTTLGEAIGIAGSISASKPEISAINPVMVTLLEDVTIDNVISIPATTFVKLVSLPSGKTIKRGLLYDGFLIKVEIGRYLELGGDGPLTIDGDGMNVTASKALITVDNGGTLTISSDTVTLKDNNNTNVNSAYGGGVFVVGTFTMSGGLITGNKAVYTGTDTNGSGFGGGVLVSGGTFTMSGGSITENKADYTDSGSSGGFGGGVYISGPKGILTMKGGSITKNEAVKGAGVHIDNGKFTMEGSASIAENDARDGGGGLGGGVFVGDTTSCTFEMKNGTISQNTSDNSGGGVYILSGTVTTAGVQSSGFFMTGGTISDNEAVAGGGVYVFGGAISMSSSNAAAAITGNKATSSSLGGGGVYMESSTFTMTGGIIGGGDLPSNALSGGGVYMVGGTFNLEGAGFITGNTATSYGGGVYQEGGNFNQSGGSIGRSDSPGDGNTAQYGGGVYVKGNGTFTLSAGSISGNTASDGSSQGEGGGVYVSMGTFNLEGDGFITGNTAVSLGGGVYTADTFSQSGGTIGGASGAGNTAQDGGGVYMAAGVVTMSGGSISWNEATNTGGGVRMAGGTFTMSAGTIASNSADVNGGGVYMTIGGFTLQGNGSISSTISSNTADSGGGVYMNGSGTFTLKDGGSIVENTATGNYASQGGGGVYVNDGNLNMNGGSITGNNASGSGNGNGVFLAGGSFTHTGVTVDDAIYPPEL
ncbi:hypothetical protein LQZ19_19090 [Treponema primitia]|uniref:beta strand repeat-containing protein n=1 Tax=Treponema primitia TaxID=88058 RepID=UPI003980D9CE